jgi:ubiquitin-protein ligase
MSKVNFLPQIISRLMSEIRDLNRNPPDGIRYAEDETDGDISEIHAIISGPGTN